jgi:ribosomal protein S12 methylthiotransferase accessory factor
MAPSVTLQRFERHVSSVAGAVPTLEKIPGPEPLHVYTAGGPVARVHGDSNTWEAEAGMLSSGKGTTDDDARASALCEALERYSGGFNGDEPRRSATLAELGDAAIHPNAYMNFSATQYAERERWNAQARSFRTYVPEPFDARERIEWSPVWSLTNERERLVPTALCYYGAHGPGARFCVADSNGNAAGNTIEEAILHGLLELVERDHVALWWYNRLPLPGVDLDSLDDAWLSRLRVHIADQGRNRLPWRSSHRPMGAVSVWASERISTSGVPLSGPRLSSSSSVSGRRRAALAAAPIKSFAWIDTRFCGPIPIHPIECPPPKPRSRAISRWRSRPA